MTAQSGGLPLVVIVEDEGVVRMAMAEALLESGCAVAQAPDADEALIVLKNAGSVALIVTDLGLPGAIDGRTLIAKAREAFPGLPAILITGFARPETALADARDAIEVIEKPFAPEDLVRRVLALIDAKGG